MTMHSIYYVQYWKKYAKTFKYTIHFQSDTNNLGMKVCN